MVPLELAVLDTFMYGASKMALAQRNDAIEAFLFHRTPERTVSAPLHNREGTD
jgi:hypothetical protein